MLPKKYIVESGFVKSANDAASHFITCKELICLYKVNPRECICNPIKYDSLKGLDKLHLRTLKVLKPRVDGDYNIETAPLYLGEANV